MARLGDVCFGCVSLSVAESGRSRTGPKMMGICEAPVAGGHGSRLIQEWPWFFFETWKLF